MRPLTHSETLWLVAVVTALSAAVLGLLLATGIITLTTAVVAAAVFKVVEQIAQATRLTLAIKERNMRADKKLKKQLFEALKKEMRNDRG